ncbi:hypothetical protein [Pontixanthobacter aquaemixtae]|uniref:Uncharacterized protein n=1 Tax=Pontixanthobacter aquaemixtae TaxID=1958940 RepID=A0A844ZTG0_9SPHN|nr:hypothetical protein [Pontixanthobacter aquaemixtae]MXO90592.1 hypothetical protein [Pontixanthobacter aquaemixtae]
METVLQRQGHSIANALPTPGRKQPRIRLHRLYRSSSCNRGVRSMNLSRLLTTGLTAMLILPSAAYAEDAKHREAAAESIANSDAANIERGGPIDGANGLVDAPRLEALATEDGGKVSIQWTFSGSKPGISGQQNSDGSYDIQYSRFTLGAERTVKGSTDNVALFGLDGFETGTSAKLQWTNYLGAVNFNKATMADIRANLAIAVRNCMANNAAMDKKDLTKKCDPQDPGNSGVDSFIQNHAPELLAPSLEAVFTSSTKFFGLEAEINRSKFDFLDRTTFDLKTNSETGFTAGAFAGILFHTSPSSIEISAKYQRSYKAADAIEICQPIAGTTQLECKSGADGAPTRTNKAIVALRGTHGVKDSDGSIIFALSPEFSVDVKNDDYAIDVPVYFVPSKKGPLNGGIRFGYTDKSKVGGGRVRDFSAGLFFGVSFGQIR